MNVKTVGRRQVLKVFSRALGHETHVLKHRPDLLWQQMYNRLQWEGELVKQVLSPELEQRSIAGSSPWARIRSPYRESKSIIRILISNEEDVAACACSPDGTRIASAHGNEIKIWDAKTGKELLSLKGHTRWVSECTFSHDGLLILSSSADRTVKLWDARNGNELRTFVGHNGPVNGCTISPNGAYIVSASEDNTLKIWDSVSGKNTQTLVGEVKTLNPSMNDCAVSPDSRWVTSANEDGTLKMWDVRSGKLLLDLIGPDISAYTCTVSPNGKLIVSGGYATKIWDAKSGKKLHNLNGHKDAVQSCAFSPDGRWIVTASLDTTLKIWDAESGEELRTLTGHSDVVNACAFSPDGLWIVSASRDKTLRIWDAATHDEDQDPSGHRYWINACSLSPNGKWAVSTSADKSIKVWDTAIGKELHSFSDHHCELFGCAVSPDSTWFAAGGQDKLIIWDAAHEFKSHTLISHLSTGILEGEFDCAVSPDGTWILSASSDQTLKIWDSASNIWLRTLTGHSGNVQGCAISPNGERIISASADKTLKIWDASTGQMLKTLNGHDDVVYACAASPDGAWMVSASRDNTLRIWNTSSGETLRTLIGHADAVNDVAITQDSAWIISCSKDNTIRIWNAQDGRETVTIPMPAAVNCVALHPSPPIIACGDQGGSFYLLELISLPINPLIATASSQGQKLVLRCPACSNELPISADQLGKEYFCPYAECHARLLVNPFVISKLKSATTQHVEMKVSSQIAMSNDGKLLLGYSNGSIGLWRNGKNQPDIITGGEHTPVTVLAITPDGSKGISGSSSGNICIWDLFNQSLRNRIPHSGGITAVAIGKDDWVAIGYGEEGTLEFWEFYEPTRVVKVPLKSEITAIKILTEGHILVGTKDKHAFIIDMANKKVVQKYGNLVDHITVIGASQTSKRIIAGLADDHVFHGSVGESFSTLRIKSFPMLAASVGDHPYLITGGVEGIMKVIDFDTKKSALSLEFNEKINRGALSPDGDFYAVLVENGKVYRGEISRLEKEDQYTQGESDLRPTSSKPLKKIQSDHDEKQIQEDVSSNNERIAADKLQQQPHLVTAIDSADGPVIYCPVCQFCQPISREMLGKEMDCKNPVCNMTLKINVFVARFSDSREKKKGKK